MVTALRERHFLVLLGRRTMAWRRFLRSLAEDPGQDLAVLRLRRHPPLGWRYYVWVTYRLERTRRGRPRLIPQQLFMPADEDADSRLGTPPELADRPFFDPDEEGATSPDSPARPPEASSEPPQLSGVA